METKTINNKAAVMADPAVRGFCKNIILEAQSHDPVDAINDVELALEVLEIEYAKMLSGRPA